LAPEDSLEMRPLSLIPIGILVAGLALVAVSVASGEADVSLVVVFPVISGSGPLFLIGVALVVTGVLTCFLLLVAPLKGSELQAEDLGRRDADGGAEGRSTKYGGVVLIGPVPIAFGSSARIAYVMLAVAVGIAILLLVLALL
jgi:uncharacterized protein (TIGR00304 family)